MVLNGVLGLDQPCLAGDRQRQSPRVKFVAGPDHQCVDNLLQIFEIFIPESDVGAAHVPLDVGLDELNQLQPVAALAELFFHPLIGTGLRQFFSQREAALDGLEFVFRLLCLSNQFFVRFPGGPLVFQSRRAAPDLLEQLGPGHERPVAVPVTDERQDMRCGSADAQWLQQLRGPLSGGWIHSADRPQTGFQFAGELLQIRFAYGPQQIGKIHEVAVVGVHRDDFQKLDHVLLCQHRARLVGGRAAGRCRCTGRGRDDIGRPGRRGTRGGGAGDGADQVPVSGLGRLIVGK